MPFVPVPETAQVRMQFLLAGQRCENVYHVRRQGAWSQDNLNQIAETFRNWWMTTMRGMIPTQVTLTRVIARDISVEGGISVEQGQGLPAAGTLQQNALPNNVTLSVKWGTGLAGRSFRGRTYHIQLSSNMVQADHSVLSGSLEALRQNYDALRTALDNVALGVEFVVVSRFANKQPRLQGLTTPISGVSIEPYVDSQRRRLPGRGR